MSKKVTSQKKSRKTSESKRKEYIEKLTEQLKKWDQELAVFEKKSDKRIAELKTNLTQKLATIKQKQNELKDKINRVGGISEDAYRKVKVDIEKLWKDITKSFKGLRKELKK